MDDLPLPRTEARCPVTRCPWKYMLTTPHRHPDDNVRSDRVRMVIPPPEGKHLRNAEIAAGIAAARKPRMAALGGIDGIAAALMESARAQDDAVFAVHLASHPRAELAEAFPGRLDEILATLVHAGRRVPPEATGDGCVCCAARFVGEHTAAGCRECGHFLEQHWAEPLPAS